MRNKNKKVYKQEEVALKSEDCKPSLSDDTVKEMNNVINQIYDETIPSASLRDLVINSIDMNTEILNCFKGGDMTGQDDLAVAYRTIESAIVRLKAARDKL